MNDNGRVANFMENFCPDKMKSCLIGIGGYGKAVADKINEIKEKYAGSENIIWDYFDSFTVERESHLLATGFPLKKYDLVFLVGSPENPEFIKTRKTANRINPYLMLSIMKNKRTAETDLISNQIHSCEIIIIPDGDFVEISAQIVQDFYSTFSVPPLVCLGIDDVKEGLSGRLCSCVSVEGSNETVIELLKNHQKAISHTQGILFILSYDTTHEITLNEMMISFDLIDEYGSEVATILNTITGIQKIPKEVRGLLIYALDSISDN